jgi:hypothetical protein
MAAIKNIMDFLPEIERLRNEGLARGSNTGFKCLDELYSIKKGSYTTVLAEPGHGKSEFILELCMNQAIKFGEISLICSPETGTPEEIVAELMHKYTGKSMLKSGYDPIDDKQFYVSLEWLNHHFIIPEDQKSYSVKDLFEYAYQWEKENERQINIVVGEPYNELNHDMSKYGNRQDLYIEDLYSYFRREVRKSNKHFFLSIHPSSQQPVTEKGITYYPKPLPRQAAGGQAAFRKSMTWITLWRPNPNLTDESGWKFKDNEVHVYIDKAKPKGVSVKGMCKMFFDWKKNRYYEEIGGVPHYAFNHEEIPKNAGFIIPINTKFDDEEPPF